MGKNRPTPEVLSLIICDQIITDRVTGKQSLIGMFSRVHARGFPATHAQLCVFVTLTGGHGDTDLLIRLVDSAESRAPIVVGKGSVRFNDPRAVANLVLQFNGLTFPEAGEYRVQLLAQGELLREARLEMVEHQLPKPKKSEPPTDGPRGDEG